MQTRTHQGHLLIEGRQQILKLALAQPAAQQLRALTQQTAIAAEQLGIHRLQLEHHPIQPLAPQGWLTADEFEVERAESNAAERPDEIELPLEHLAVAPGDTPALAAQIQLHAITTGAVGGDQGLALPMTDQIAIGAAAMGAEAAQQFHRFEQIRFAFTVAANDQQPRRLQIQMQRRDIAKLTQLQALQPNRSEPD